MGLFNFARDAGKNLFGGDLTETKVREHLIELGLDINPLSIIIGNAKDGIVTLVGYARTLADKEKALVAVGNIKGVETVEDRLRIGSPDWKKAEQGDSFETPEAQKEATPASVDHVEHPEKAAGPSEEEAPTAKFYTVESGDTLGKIAKELYGNAGQYPVIFEANKPMLTDPDKIYPGQVLRIPPLDD